VIFWWPLFNKGQRQLCASFITRIMVNDYSSTWRLRVSRANEEKWLGLELGLPAAIWELGAPRLMVSEQGSVAMMWSEVWSIIHTHKPNPLILLYAHTHANRLNQTLTQTLIPKWNDELTTFGHNIDQKLPSVSLGSLKRCWMILKKCFLQPHHYPVLITQ